MAWFRPSLGVDPAHWRSVPGFTPPAAMMNEPTTFTAMRADSPFSTVSLRRVLVLYRQHTPHPICHTFPKDHHFTVSSHVVFFFPGGFLWLRLKHIQARYNSSPTPFTLHLMILEPDVFASKRDSSATTNYPFALPRIPLMTTSRRLPVTSPSHFLDTNWSELTIPLLANGTHT